MESLPTHFRASALTLYMNYQPSKEHPGHRAQSEQRCCQCPPGQDQPRPNDRGMAEVSKAAQNTSRGEKAVTGCVHVPAWALSCTWKQHVANCVPCFVLHLLQSSHSYRTGGEIPIIHSGDRAESTFLTAPRKRLTQPGRLKRQIQIVFPSPPASATV